MPFNLFYIIITFITFINTSHHFQLVLGFGTPVKLGSKQSMAVGWNFQFQYPEATNITQLQVYPPVVSSRAREKREMQESDRSLFYMAVEGILDREGINGRECILRSICENAADSTFHEANGLYGHLLHIALTPTYGDGEIDEGLDPAYLEAQKAGQYGVECYTLYPNCNLENGLLGFFSVLENELQK
ncbi:hypothetical protein NQ318_015707 [Aromia moschata]|uniref:Uncharacterized protein n=1 Tax=Aromia moschata TaxID=1265417 RepID=A0AAV8YJ94_9CUCU|nr:hypothetical protein NQ318_015707 [Aromia moschata]